MNKYMYDLTLSVER